MAITPKPLKVLRKITKWNKGKKVLQSKILGLESVPKQQC